jgi:hypothetical protein
MNHKITQVFVPASVNTSLGTDGLGKQVMGIYNPSTYANIGGTTADADFLVAIGSDVVGSKYGSFKSSPIKLSNIISTRKTVADTSVQQQITYIGYDEVNDGKSPAFACDEEYTLTIKIDEYWSKGVFQPMIQESVRVKTTCCSECGGGCDALGCYPFMIELVNKVNNNPLLSKYVTASMVNKGTAPTYKFRLVLLDPGADPTTAVRAAYASYVANSTTDIVVTSDPDGSGDDVNIMYELTSNVAAINSGAQELPPYNGIAWEKYEATAGSVTACGIKLTGKALDEFGNACVPDAVPYVFNLVRFQAVVHKGPFTTMDFDLPSDCGNWSVTKVQDIKYPVGVGAAIAEFERHHFGNNLPATADARYYWNPIYNEDTNKYLYVSSVSTYDMFEITYLEDSPVGFENKTRNTHSLVILAVSSVNGTPTSTVPTAVTTALNNVLPTALHV